MKQQDIPDESKKTVKRKKRTTGFLGLGFLCGSFEPVCSSLFCQGDDEDLIGKVVGGADDDDDEHATPDTSVEYDADDPRY